MKKTERTISIIMLFIISLSNVATPVAYAAETGKVHLKFSGTTRDIVPSDVPAKFSVDKGSVLGSSTSLLTVGTQNLDLRAGNTGSAYRRIPIRMQRMERKVYQTDEDVNLAVVNPNNEVFTTTVQDATGKTVTVPVTESNNGTTTTVTLASSNVIKPGLYKVKITDEENQTTEQDFSWGVLALNTDKSVYHPGDTAAIAMAVLNDKGDMVCDAQLVLSIKNTTLGVNDSLSTGTASASANQITVNPQCQKHDFSLQPDYEAHYKFNDAGIYNFQLTAVTQNGTHTITDSLQVTDQIPFDVQRVSATRIYPPNTYPMLFNVTAHQDFSGTVTETVPESFTITPATQSASQSYTDMQTVYLNSNDPAALMSQQIASASGGLVMPFHGNYPITQGFGAELTDPTLQAFYTQYGLGGHDGIDFGLPTGTVLYAVDSGSIVWSGPGDYGTTVIIQHSWGKTYYGHLSNTSVTVGQQVTKGQLIGYSGQSGEATGPHLHFGMKPNSADLTNGYYGKIDPMPFLPFGHIAQGIPPSLSMAPEMTVLGASDSATPTQGESPTPSPTILPSLQPTASANPTPTEAASNSATAVTPTPMSAVPPSVPSIEPSQAASPAANETFTVLEKEIRINEQLASSAQTQKVKVITWHMKLKKGESTSLGYMYQTPKVSPQFYLLGPAKFYAIGSDKVIFQEQRQWEIASDDVGVEWYQNTTGNKWNGYSWQYRKKLDISLNNVYATPSAQTVNFMDSGGDSTGQITTANGGFFSATANTGAGTESIDNTTSETGPDSIKFSTNTSGDSAAVSANGILAAAGRRISGYFKFSGFPSGGRSNFISIDDSGDANDIFNVDVAGISGTPGQLTLRTSDPGGSNLATGSTLSTNTWYRISISYVITSTTNYSVKVYLNGTLTMSYSQTSGAPNALASATPADLCVGICGNTSDNLAYNINMDDLYVNSGSDLADPGDVHVTAKRPFANGTTNNFTSTGSASGYGSGNAQYVNERPLNISNFVSLATVTTKKTEEYNIESRSTGDVNIPNNAGIAGYMGWIYADNGSSSNSPSAHIILNGAATIKTLTQSPAMYTLISSTTTYPSGTGADIGMDGQYTITGHSYSLFESGIQVAYIPDLINFPVLINLSSDNDLKGSHTQSNGNDILFTDSTGRNLLPYEVENYNNTTGSLQAWVKIASLSTATDTIIYMYFGNPSTASLASTSTWNGNYAGVWHLGASSGTTASDSTANGNTGTLSGTGGPTWTSGEIGNAVTFNNSLSVQDNLINAGSGASLTSLNATGMTVGAWVFITDTLGTANDSPIIEKVDNVGFGHGWYLYYDGCCENLGFQSSWSTTNLIHETNNSALTFNTWQYVVATWDGSATATNVHFYINGVEATYNGTQNGVGSYNNDSGDSLTMAESADTFSQPYIGSTDEVEVSNIIRSPGWITTQYKNQSNPGPGAGGFVSVLGSVETDIYAPVLSQLMRHGEWFDSTGKIQPFTF